jgi:hypothetical protein
MSLQGIGDFSGEFTLDDAMRLWEGTISANDAPDISIKSYEPTEKLSAPEVIILSKHGKK